MLQQEVFWVVVYIVAIHAHATTAQNHELSESVRLIVSRRFLYASSCSSCVPLRMSRAHEPKRRCIGASAIGDEERRT
ncbi:hypothetical protein C8T65DRAFT_629478 [Cerioporus squamosus]|nr:hypothetical protein C8T65DRAFT_629478 [Cerioporus squamosus]